MNLVSGFTLREIASSKVAKQRRDYAHANGAIDPMDLDDIDRALASLENPDCDDSLCTEDAIGLIREILSDYRRP